MKSEYKEHFEKSLSSAIIALSLLLGVLFPSIASSLYKYLFLSLFFLIVLSLCALEEDPITIFSAPNGFVISVLLWQMFALPAIISLGCYAFGVSDFFTTVLVASAASGAVFASPTLAQVLGLDSFTAAHGMLLSTLLVPFSLVIFGELNGFIPLSMSFEIYAVQLVLFIIIPFTIAILAKSNTSAPLDAAMKRRWFRRGSTLAVAAFCCGMMHVIHEFSGPLSPQVLGFVCVSIVFSAGILIVTWIAFARFGRERALLAAILSANRNLALSFVLMSSVLPHETLVYIAAAQFPIFLAPVLLRLGRWIQVKMKIQKLSSATA